MEWRTFIQLPQPKFDNYMLKMQVTHLCSEDLFFMGVGVYLINLCVMYQELNYTVFISVAISCISSLLVNKNKIYIICLNIYYSYYY